LTAAPADCEFVAEFCVALDRLLAVLLVEVLLLEEEEEEEVTSSSSSLITELESRLEEVERVVDEAVPLLSAVTRVEDAPEESVGRSSTWVAVGAQTRCVTVPSVATLDISAQKGRSEALQAVAYSSLTHDGSFRHEDIDAEAMHFVATLHSESTVPVQHPNQLRSTLYMQFPTVQDTELAAVEG